MCMFGALTIEGLKNVVNYCIPYSLSQFGAAPC